MDYLNESNLLCEDDILIGDDTTALLLHLQQNEGELVGQFYRKVIQFYLAFVKKQLKSFDFQSPVICTLSYLDPIQAQQLPVSTFDLTLCPHAPKYLIPAVAMPVGNYRAAHACN